MKKNNKKLLKVTLSTVLCLVCMVTKHTTAMTEEELLGLGLSEGGTEMLRILPRIKQLSEKIKQFEQQSYQVAKQNPLSRPHSSTGRSTRKTSTETPRKSRKTDTTNVSANGLSKESTSKTNPPAT